MGTDMTASDHPPHAGRHFALALLGAPNSVTSPIHVPDGGTYGCCLSFASCVGSSQRAHCPVHSPCREMP
ncbi:hypothetical protein CHELA40_50333 [Chelatococcus asaccharovorans]|nr:hypothetical protein CHELA17_20298 [Chelatococcus asaccharovorans]CAH1692358.1 hypothetical protein CHELA40_50333 [Chelatococcus asaccharovorans]